MLSNGIRYSYTIDKVRLDPDFEPSDQEMMSSFGTKWHDGL